VVGVAHDQGAEKMRVIWDVLPLNFTSGPRYERGGERYIGWSKATELSLRFGHVLTSETCDMLEGYTKEKI